MVPPLPELDATAAPASRFVLQVLKEMSTAADVNGVALITFTVTLMIWRRTQKENLSLIHI